MPSFLELLGGSAGKIYPIVKRGVREGLSIERIGSAVRGGGYSIANDKLRSLVSRERGIREYFNNLRNINLDKKPDITRIPEALDRIQRRYSYQLEVRGVNLRTGAIETRNITISTNDLLTRREAIDDALDTVKRDRGRYELTSVSAEVVGILRGRTF